MRLVRDRRPLLMAAAMLVSSLLPLAVAGCGDGGASNGAAVPVSDDALKKKADILKNIRQQNYDAHKRPVPPTK